MTLREKIEIVHELIPAITELINLFESVGNKYDIKKLRVMREAYCNYLQQLTNAERIGKEERPSWD